MTRLSDLLRGAADRAPVGENSVARDRVARRVRLNRGIRGAGNGLAGVGAAALVVVALVQPGFGVGSKDSGAPNAAAAPRPANDGVGAGESALAPDTRLADWGTCGSFPLQDYGSGGSDSLGITVGFDGNQTPDGGSTIEVPYTITAHDATDVSTQGPTIVVLWQGMVVASVSGSGTDEVLALADGDTSIDKTVSLPLVDCFDGNPLPASKYELVVSQAFTDVEPVVEPAPIPEPTLVPDLPVTPSAAPSAEPSAQPLPPATGSAATDAVEPDIAPLPVEPYGWDVRVTSEPIGFAIAGDPVDNPFAQYYPEPWSPPAPPSDVLSPDMARTLFDAAATTTPWTMAAGTSRWILPNGAGGRETFAAEQAYYGCSWDGTTGLTFPERSADLGLVSTQATIPGQVSVSYGWVVDNNPEITLAVTNTSEYSLPGFYGEPNRNLYLVKDGKVVAQAFPANVDPYGGPYIMKGGMAVDTDPASDGASGEDYWGTLAPGASISGTYLWRDVNMCSGDGSSSLAAGTYTLLTMQSVSLQQYGTTSTGGIVPPIPEPLIDPNLAASSGEASADGGAIEPAIGVAVAPYQEDWLEMQVWTSLGSVTITTH